MLLSELFEEPELDDDTELELTELLDWLLLECELDSLLVDSLIELLSLELESLLNDDELTLLLD